MLLGYENPLVNEVEMVAYIPHLHELRDEHINTFASVVRDNSSFVQQQLPTDPKAIVFALDDDTRLTIQRDALIINSRRPDNEHSHPYWSVKPEFDKWLGRFGEFVCNEPNFADVTVNGFGLTYSNGITKPELWGGALDAMEINEPSQMMMWSVETPDSQLAIDILKDASVQETDSSPFIIGIRATGSIESPEKPNIDGWFERAHNAIIECWEQHAVFTDEDKKAQIRETYRGRVEELREYGEEDGISLNPGSEEDLYTFLESLPVPKKASLALIYNGNLRAVWRRDDGSHLGVQFLGNQQAQYVIFKPMPDGTDIWREAATGTFAEAKERLKELEMEWLVCG